MAESISPTFWARMLGVVRSKYWLRIGVDLLRYEKPSESREILFEDIGSIHVEKHWLWHRLQVRDRLDKSTRFSGLSSNYALGFLASVQLALDRYQTNQLFIQSRLDELQLVHTELIKLTTGQVYAAKCLIDSILAMIDSLEPVLSLPHGYLPRDGYVLSVLVALEDFRQNHEARCESSNEAFIQRELVVWKDYLDTIETNPLTEMQRRAVLIHEDNTLVIAGAGSGKTSVILAKTGYLLQKGLASPKTLLLLAFNKKAAEEMTNRIESRLEIAAVQSFTFHALGLGIIAAVEGRKPALTAMAEDDIQLQNFIQTQLEQLILAPDSYQSAISYFKSYFAPYKNFFDFESLGDYFGYVRANEMRTFQGERCRSYEEVEIANHLFTQGIFYEYEAPYAFSTATVGKRQYKPDFYLPEYKIYIEHFGVDEQGTPPAWMSAKEAQDYRKSMDWKRRLHLDNGTILIESYSWQKKQGVLLYSLSRNLRRHGVKFAPITPGKALEALRNNNRFSRFTDVAKTFLGHFKGNGYTCESLESHAKENSLWDSRMAAFLTLFGPILRKYNEHLETRQELDFNDMIVRAAGYVERGHYVSPYQCILVDEFQDISSGRARLIKALVAQKRDNRLFCVGDDWQAIYRFSGSDISIMGGFSNIFGRTEQVTLDRTFRFNDGIEAVASQFVLRNDKQIPKQLKTQNTTVKPTVILHHPASKDDPVISHAVGMIVEDAEKRGLKKATVMFLARYRFEFEGLEKSEFCMDYPSLEFSNETIHKAKGLEADYVIVLGLRAAVYGFPSEVADDPLLDAVLASPEEYPHAEERRLFYVAITRARHAAHVIVDRIAPSHFAMELISNSYPITCIGTLAAPVNCPTCKTGVLVQRSSEYGVFYSCIYHPLCSYKTRPCPQCGAGLMLLDKAINGEICTNKYCKHSERYCPICKKGRMVERTGQFGLFWGCTEYRNGCRHTESLKSGRI